MDPDSGADSQRALSLQWKSYKLLQDPAIRRVAQKLYRYDGIHFSLPDSGFPPIGEVRDPRPRRIWSRHTDMVLPLPKFKLDEFYVGPIPLKEVTFAHLNDNIREPFLAEMCAKYGEVEEMEILFHPKTRKHLGLARVLFTSTRGAKDTVKHLHNTSVMGTKVHVQLDIKGQQRMKFYDLIVNGSYTPQTVPTGGKALTERLQPLPPTQPDTSSDVRRRLSTDQLAMSAGVPPVNPGSMTPCSADTGFGHQRLDNTPSSLGGPYTPGSNSSQGGTPYTPRSGTPFSQDSGYSGSRHGGFSGAPMGSGYPLQDMLPSSSSSSSAVSSSSLGGFKGSRYHDDPHMPPQEPPPSMFHRGHPPGYPPPTGPFRPNEPPAYPPYTNPPMAHQMGIPPPMPPPSQVPPPQYEPTPMPERERERDRERAPGRERDRDRDRERDSGGRHSAVGSRRGSYHQQHQESITGSSSSSAKSSYHSHHTHHGHHSERRSSEDRERGSYRRDSVGSRSGEHSGHQRHRNHHHSHNHHGSGRRRDSRDRDREWERERERDGPDYTTGSDPRYNSSSGHHRSSNSLSPPYSSSSSSSSSSKDHLPQAHHQEPSSSSRLGSSSDGDFRSVPQHTQLPPPPPPPPPPLPPASVIAAAVAETLGALDFGQDSPIGREEQWTKPKRRPSTPPLPPRSPPPSSPLHPSATTVASSTSSPSSTSLSHHLPPMAPSSTSGALSPSLPQRGDSSPEPDSTNESLPFMHHSSSLDSRIEMLLKEQKAKFSFLASDEEEEDGGQEEKSKGARGSAEGKQGAEAALEKRPGAAAGGGDTRSRKPRSNDAGEQERQRRKGEREMETQPRRRGEREGRRHRGRKQSPDQAEDGRKSPAVIAMATPSSTTPSALLDGLQHPPGVASTYSQEEVADKQKKGAHTPPTYNGEAQASPRSSGEDMEISDEEEEGENPIATAAALPSSSSPPTTTSQSVLPAQTPEPSLSPPPISDSTPHFNSAIPPPPIPSYPPHLPPPPPPGFSLQPPPPPGIPPPMPHMELHPEYPPPLPPHLSYDYAASMEMMSQYSGGAPMSFQMQTQMLSRMHQMRVAATAAAAASNGTAAPPPGEGPPVPPPPPPGTTYHLHSMPPPPHHPYMDQEGSAGAHYDQDHRYMPPHMPPFPYPDPHTGQLPPPPVPPPPHHTIPPPGWPPHVLPQHPYPTHYPPPPPFGALASTGTTPGDGEQYVTEGEPQVPLLGQSVGPHEATVQLVMGTLIQEMKNIMQRDLKRKMVENIAFGTFDEWWERKERKAKPFQTPMRGLAVRDEEKKEEKALTITTTTTSSSRPPREPLMSLVDWAKSGGMEGFSLRGALRLPSFKVKRKEPQELNDGGELKIKRPSTPPDEEDEDSYQGKVVDDLGGRGDGDGRGLDRDSSRRRKRRTRRRKSFDLDSEGEETSEGSSSEKEDEEEDSEKEDESEDEALSADSDDESLSSSSGSSSSSSLSSSSSSEDEEEEEEEGELVGESEGLDTMDESTMESVPLDSEKEKESNRALVSQPTPDVDSRTEPEVSGVTPLPKDQRPPSPPRPSSPVLLLPPLKKRRKTVSFTEDGDFKPPSGLLTPALSATPSPPLTPSKAQPPEPSTTAVPAAPTTPAPSTNKTPMLLPFASRPSEGNALSPSPGTATILTVPPPVRALRPEEPKKGPAAAAAPTPPPAKQRRGPAKDTPRPAPICRTVQNLPLDHASLVRVAYEEPPPPPAPPHKGRGRGRPRTSSLSAPSPAHPTLLEEDEEEFDEEELEEREREQRLRLREQLGASSLLQLASAPPTPHDLSVLADVALTLEPGDLLGDSEETETSDEAEEHKLEEDDFLFSPRRTPMPLAIHPEGLLVLAEHNYFRPPILVPSHSPISSAPHAHRKGSSNRQDASLLLPSDLNHQHAMSSVLEAPEEVIGEAVVADAYGSLGVLCEAGDMAETAGAKVLAATGAGAKRRGPAAARDAELEAIAAAAAGKSKKRRRKDSEEQEVLAPKKQKEKETKKQKKRKQEEVEPEEEVDVEQLESGELSDSDDLSESDDELYRPSLGGAGEELRKSERLFLQEAGLTPAAQRHPKHAPQALPHSPSPPPPQPPRTYDLRSEFEQMTILYDIWNSGLDAEDMRLLRDTYERLLQNDQSSDWLNDTHWVPHTVTNLPNPRRRKKGVDSQLREHTTGSARSEGYYAISRKEKDVYLDLDLPEANHDLECDISGSNRLLSERRSEQRRLLSAIGTPAVMDSDLLKLNQLKFRKKKLRFGRSRIHEWGLFAMEPIAADEMVIEYVGQKIRQMVADNREKRYAQEGIGSSYLFRVDHDTIIDATKCGNLARFINHCCTPNCYAKVITIESQKKIVIYSKQAIGVNEEITYDYKFPIEENKIPCLCGTENCRGTLN